MSQAESNTWYEVKNIADIDTPALLVFPDRVKKNIAGMIKIAGGPEKLRPHVKTYKMPEIVRMQLEAGIKKFKCATVAEAEMCGIAKAPDVLLAYPVIGPKVARLFNLTRFYPQSRFSVLVDDITAIDELSSYFSKGRNVLNVFVDIDSGNHRTGVVPDKAFQVFEHAWNTPALNPVGLHVYDGHIRDSELSARKKKCDAEFRAVEELALKISEKFSIDPEIVAGGTPTFPVHAMRNHVTCSPGTTLFWDWGYDTSFKDLNFEFSAIIVTRIVSKPGNDLLCLDLGHKSIAAENPLNSRVHLLNLPVTEFIGHSEEHLVVRVKDNKKYEPGQVIYGIPHHICPTTALYERVFVIEKSRFTKTWRVIARDRMINH
jgi:D-threonine aldolase